MSAFFRRNGIQLNGKIPIFAHLLRGEMPEWSIGPHSKCGVRATVPGVRIPLSPLEMPNRPEATDFAKSVAFFIAATAAYLICLRRSRAWRGKQVDVCRGCRAESFGSVQAGEGATGEMIPGGSTRPARKPAGAAASIVNGRLSDCLLTAECPSNADRVDFRFRRPSPSRLPRPTGK